MKTLTVTSSTHTMAAPPAPMPSTEQSGGTLVPTKFVWRLGGSHVFLCGSFTRWVETVPMAADPTNPGTFTCTVHLNPGYHQFKFIVDQEWRHDPGMPAMPDPIVRA